MCKKGIFCCLQKRARFSGFSMMLEAQNEQYIRSVTANGCLTLGRVVCWACGRGTEGQKDRACPSAHHESPPQLPPLLPSRPASLSTGASFLPASLPASLSPPTTRVVRIANRANREAPKSGDSCRIARRSIKSRIARIVI